MKPTVIVTLLLVLIGLSPRAQAAQLVMVEQRACSWCEVWDREVGIVYHKTPEGKTAPLRRVDIHDELPGDLKFIKGLIYTPTFVLVDRGKEVGRIRGYPGEDFFWGQLNQMLKQLPAGPRLKHMKTLNEDGVL